MLKKKFWQIANGRTKGFTMVEMIIVIIISGILAAVVLPKLANNDIALYSVAGQVKSDIRYTQELAMSKFKKTTIAFSTGTANYTISDASGTIESKTLPVRSNATFDNSQYSGLTFTFNSFGEPITGDDETVRISSKGSHKDILVEDVTGRATIQ